MILVVAATEKELTGAGAAHTLCCGIGPVEAAAATARALAEERPDAVLHVGIAGAPAFETDSVVVGSAAVYVDLVAPPGSTLPRVLEVLPSPALVEAIRRVAPDARLVPIHTSGRVGGGGDCEVEAMEGFAVLRAAELAGVPAVEVRVISNRPSEHRSAWRIEEAFAKLEAILPALIREVEACVR